MMILNTRLFLLIFTGLVLISSNALAAPKPEKPVSYHAVFAKQAPTIDGDANDTAWQRASWREVPYLITGRPPENKRDLSMRYKAVWTSSHLYILAEVSDEKLIDSHPDPLDHYWDDDALEIFIDEDNSGGEHLHSYNAFAYHIALDNQAVDIGPFLSDTDKAEGKTHFRTYPDHVEAKWKRAQAAPYHIYWEVKIAIYPDSYKDAYAKHETPATPLVLAAGKKIGFMMSYCDSDSDNGREHFIGDIDIAAVDGDKNRGFIDASVFGVLKLVDNNSASR